MANALYDKGRERFLIGAFNWSTDTIKCLLVDTGSYTPNLSAHEFHSDISSGAIISTSGAFSSKTTSGGAADAADVTHTSVTGASVEAIVIYKDKAKKALGLPETVKADPDKHVVASTQVKSSERPTTVSAVYDSKLGNVDMYLRQDPYPWFGSDKKWLIGGFYGYSDDSGDAVGELLGMYDLFQIKALHIGPMGHIDTDGRRFLGAGFWFSGR